MASHDISPQGMYLERAGWPVDPDILTHVPLSESTFYILLSLAPGRKHGYAILKDVEALSSGDVCLSTSTLYSTLHRLLDRGLIERVSGSEDGQLGPGLPRKAYVLTGLGRRVLQADARRMQGLVAAARLRLGEEAV